MFGLLGGGRSTQGPAPSDLARKYGRARSPPLKDTGKSGMTPVSLQPMDDSYSAERDELDLGIYQYQIQRLSGFSVNELVDTGVINAPNAHLGDLDNPIHPLYRKELWIDAPDLPLGHGLNGFWSARNPAVWEVLKPILRLASLFIVNAHVWPWFDALLFCPRVELDYADMNGPGRPNWGGGIYRFNYRASHIAAQSKDSKEAQMLFDHCAQFVSMWHFNEGDSRALGITHNEMSHARIGLNVGVPEHLERLVHQFHVALTVVHETSHALDMARSYRERIDPNGGPWTLHEPFFGDEDVAELGYSVENAILGGTKEALVGPGGPGRWVSKRTIWGPMKDYETPSMGLVTASVPNYRTVNYYQERMAEETLDDSSRFMVRNLDQYAGNENKDEALGVPPNEIWPMSIQLFQNLHTKAFWESVVRVKGRPAFHSPRIKGFRVTWWTVEELEGADYQRWKDMQPLAPPDDFSNLQDAFKKWQFETDFFTRAYAIRVVLAKQAHSSRLLDGERVRLRKMERTEIKLGPEGNIQEYQARLADKEEQTRELRASIAERTRAASKFQIDLASARAKQRLVSNQAGANFVKYCDDLADAIARPAPANDDTADDDDEWEDLGSRPPARGGAASRSSAVASGSRGARSAAIARGNLSSPARGGTQRGVKRGRDRGDDDEGPRPKRQRKWWGIW
ncbi:hypothetical protein BP6252_05175 [Coleophoma cylindrospora]|uniref:Uncharacterized protein n=1 Tax=Coleophoma cylindrospora TaxID=1849047 RepID=A0A3D8RSQ2_9HELO|nr:hypothetical protein BP6252_05175 [Coleophoma cylindrospora]